jgi:hypothetical protein
VFLAGGTLMSLVAAAEGSQSHQCMVIRRQWCLMWLDKWPGTSQDCHRLYLDCRFI